MATKLTAIDALTRPDHFYLGAADTCYFYGDYTARQGYAHSPTNDLITNLKKPVNRQGKPEYRYKLQAIAAAGQILRACLNSEAMPRCTFVPVPPSRMKGDAEYDDRMVQVARLAVVGTAANVRELVIQTRTTPPVHTADERPTPDEMARIYAIDETQCHDVRQTLIVIDDMLTAGCHFVAMKYVLTARFPGSEVIGIFVARRVPIPPDFAAITGGAA